MTQEEKQDVRDYLGTLKEDVVGIKKELERMYDLIDTIQYIVSSHCTKCGENVLGDEDALCGECSNA